ncbi:MAG: outer membrane beta-barrel protein [Crocinitomix sp.]|nr:outer membrane beta-barrel protein [Crocinitomix sp.]
MIDKLIIVLSVFACSFSYGQENLKNYNGLYTGIEFGSNYMFGGAQVDKKETIGDGNVPIAGVLFGWRKAYASNFHFAIEFQLNMPFGSFANTENEDGTIVSYEIKPQSALQFNLGYTFGAKRNSLLFGYFAFNQTRFNIDITRPSGDFKQTDFENFGRVGLGYEYVFLKSFSTRIMLGTSMDALPDTDNGIDGKIALIYNFKKNEN